LLGFHLQNAIVVDNGSVDGSADMVRHDFPDAMVIENAQNKGFAAANNQGIAVARGRYVLLLNSDTIILDDPIARSIEFADHQSDVAVVGCRVLNPDRTLQASCFMFPSLLNMLLSAAYLNRLFPNNRFLSRERGIPLDEGGARDVDVVSGCFMLVRRKAIDQVGLMDEDYFMYAEETDWCWRFKKLGWRTVYLPEGEIIHLGGQSAQQVRSQMTLQLRAGVLQFFRKNRSYPEYCLACLLVAIWFGIRVPVWFIRALAVSQGKESSLERARTYLKGTVLSLGGWKRLSCRRK